VAPRVGSFDASVAALLLVYSRFDADARAETAHLIHGIRGRLLPANKSLPVYYECLLFLRAYPANAGMLRTVVAELRRMAARLRRYRGHEPAIVEQLGLPYIGATRAYSHECVRWLLRHPHCAVTFEEFSDGTRSLHDVLRLTLPSLERSTADIDCSSNELFDALRVPAARRLRFLIAELSRLDQAPAIKDELYNSLGVLVRVTPKTAQFSTAFNHLAVPAPFFHRERLTTFDSRALMNSPLPAARPLSDEERARTARVIRDTMTLTGRETDPATYLDDRSLRLYDLERGTSIAVFSMTHDRQLALESYVGFTAFKNGMPVSYGGAWVFGERADFGMNIFEPYRGGESGYLMCQLLRVYRQLFRVRYFEVDAHQFGLDNPEGIATGAFWFYYRYGFVPTDAVLRAVAQREKARLLAEPGARSTRHTLLALTGSSVALNFGGPVPTALSTVVGRVTRMIRHEYHSDRVEAERDSIARLLRASHGTLPRDPDQRAALAELALVARALRVRDASGIRLLADMVVAKPADVYRYQEQLSLFLRRPPPRRAAR
jgi:hypothetical protein